MEPVAPGNPLCQWNPERGRVMGFVSAIVQASSFLSCPKSSVGGLGRDLSSLCSPSKLSAVGEALSDELRGEELE